MKKLQQGFVQLLVLIYIAIVIVGGTGWVWNIVKICDANFAVITAKLVLRCLGVIVVPLGAVMGYL